MNQNFRESFYRLNCLDFPTNVEESLKQIESYLSYTTKMNQDYKSSRNRVSENDPDISFVKNMLFCQKLDSRGYKMNVLNPIQQLNLVNILYTYFANPASKSKSMQHSKREKSKYPEKYMASTHDNKKDVYHMKTLSDIISMAISLNNNTILNLVAHWLQKGFCDPIKLKNLAKCIMDELINHPKSFNNISNIPQHSPLLASYLFSSITNLYFEVSKTDHAINNLEDYTKPKDVQLCLIQVLTTWMEKYSNLPLLAIKGSHDKFQKAVNSHKRSNGWHDEDSQLPSKTSHQSIKYDTLKNYITSFTHFNPLPVLFKWMFCVASKYSDTDTQILISRLHLACLRTITEAPKMLPNEVFRQALLQPLSILAKTECEENGWNLISLLPLFNFVRPQDIVSKGKNNIENNMVKAEYDMMELDEIPPVELKLDKCPPNLLDKYLMVIAMGYKLKCLPRRILKTTQSKEFQDLIEESTKTTTQTSHEDVKVEMVCDDTQEEPGMLPDDKNETEALSNIDEGANLNKISSSDAYQSWISNFIQNYQAAGLPVDNKLYRIVTTLDNY